MAKVNLISIVAESPGIVTEAIEYLLKKYKKIKNIVFYPKDERIKWRIKLLKNFLKKYENVESVFLKLPVEDITSEKDIKKFLNFVKKIRKELKSKNTYFNITGGRKIMLLVLYKFLIKSKVRAKLLNIISYLPREEVGVLEDILKEKIENGIEPNEEEIRKYLFSNNNYKVFEIKL